MSLDSWIDDDAREWMRVLAPKPKSAPEQITPSVSMDVDDLLFSNPEMDAPDLSKSESAAPKIARGNDVNDVAVEKMRKRLADLRQRAEAAGMVRTSPAQLQTAPIAETAPIVEAAPIEPLVLPAGPLAVRIAACCEWIGRRAGWQHPVIFDRYGSSFHPSSRMSPVIGAALAMHKNSVATSTTEESYLSAAWGQQTVHLVVIPTCYGNLFAAGSTPENTDCSASMAEIAQAVRLATGLTPA